MERTRRSILRVATVAGAATLGGAAGVGAHALLSDRERFRGSTLASGSLDLEVAARSTVGGETTHEPPQDGSFPSTFAAESGVTVPLPTVDPDGGDASGETTVAFRACENPGRVWLRPLGDADAPLADALDVSLAYAPTWGGDDATLYEGSLSELLDEYADGVRLGSGDDCVGCEPASLELDWELADPGSVAGESLAVDLELAARQCRNTEPTNPWQ
ncbi:hypothetical protein [Halobacterium yunchengense]|uniref:hypothetical protein n=1 Tax=Halobacterium yunchengense TaxID=3108497 RepID=UPI00300A2B1B